LMSVRLKDGIRRSAMMLITVASTTLVAVAMPSAGQSMPLKKKVLVGSTDPTVIDPITAPRTNPAIMPMIVSTMVSL